ncbi:hypothetical protein NX059_011670 [Plenodomus lindquistii]|nr:hypothetical protein NX059_011670 [Plenodomus lindquistii]
MVVALLAVGIGLGAEKLSRKISDKRLEKKEKKAIAAHETIYGTPSSSLSHPAYTTRERESQTDRKREEALRELQAARQGDENVPQYASRRDSVDETRFGEEAPPPRYEDVVQQDAS